MITDNYIKMCEKSEDLQKEWKPELGDKASWNGRIFNIDNINFEPIKRIYVYLPSQEQLQEMILPVLKKKYNKHWNLVKMDRQANWIFRIFNCFLNEHSGIYSNDMNELWLAFVMKEKYNKIWTKNSWKEIKGGDI